MNKFARTLVLLVFLFSIGFSSVHAATRIVDTLAVGSSGAQVVTLQQILNVLGYFRGSADGRFNSSTQTALKSFQSLSGLTPTGTTGAQTRDLLNQGLYLIADLDTAYTADVAAPVHEETQSLDSSASAPVTTAPVVDNTNAVTATIDALKAQLADLLAQLADLQAKAAALALAQQGPAIHLSVSDLSVPAGASDTITWSAPDATSCYSSSFTADSNEGSVTVNPTETTTYTISCSNDGGSRIKSVTIAVGGDTTTTTTTVVTAPSTSGGGGSGTSVIPDVPVVTTPTVIVQSSVNLSPYSWDESRKGTPLTLSGYNLTFNEDFNDKSHITNAYGAGPIFTAIHAPIGVGAFDPPQSNYDVANGVLTMNGYKVGSSWHAGLIQTTNGTGRGFTQKYGYYESRVRIPTSAVGMWAAVWLLSPQDYTVGHIEIDSLEWYGEDPKGYHGTIHSWPIAPLVHSYKSNYVGMNGVINDGKWHTYGSLVTPTQVILYVDRKEVQRMPVPEQYAAPLYPVLSLQVNGDTAAKAIGPLQMQTDYVRIYSNDANATLANSSPDADAPDIAPVTVNLSVSSSKVAAGGPTTITWSSTNATSCTGLNFATGGGTSGSVVVRPTVATTYTVACTGADTASKTLTVFITSPTALNGDPSSLLASIQAAFSKLLQLFGVQW